MKKLSISIAALAICLTVNAQKTVVKTESFSATQARMLEVTAESFVRPLIVDLKVESNQTRMKYEHVYKRDEVEIGLGGDLDNLRSRVLYDAADSWSCDAVVAPTFIVELVQNGYRVVMKGFPANFDPTSWHPMEQKDYEWLRLLKNIPEENKEIFNRQGGVISKVKK